MSRWDVPAEPYPPVPPGTKARQLDGPVDPPSRDRPTGSRKPRRNPGDPSCDACAHSEAGYCDEHREYHHAYDPLAGLA